MYRSAMVSRTTCPDRKDRFAALREASYNIFALNSSDVYVDLLTDSGTGTMSTDQWAALVGGDESYAGSSSFQQLTDAVSDTMGFEQIVPAHQGRGAEHLLYGAVVDEGDVVLANTHFDTTRAHVAEAGGTPADHPVSDAWNPDEVASFKGNMDIDAARDHASHVGPENVPVVLLTVTNNSAAGQPVSIENIREARQFADDIDALFVIDACRFAENAWFVRERESEWSDESIATIAREQLSYADVLVMSGKKDGLANTGGFVAAAEDDALFQELKERAILYEGFYTYGGMAGRDMAALAVGLREAIDPDYLDHRIGQVRDLATRLSEENVPVYRPPGGHAVYLDAGSALTNIPPEEFPGQALVCAAYLEGGVRCVELGSFAFPGTERPELVRLAIPRRSYHREHLEHVAETFGKVIEERDAIPGMQVISEPDRTELRHFSAGLEPLGSF